MINPLLPKGRVLFVVEDCDYCKLIKSFVFELNSLLKIDKRIKIIDCTIFQKYGIITNPLIKLYEPFFDAYPTLFYQGEKKEGANSKIEYESWLRTRLMLDNAFYFEQEPEYFQTINKTSIFQPQCQIINRRLFCR